MSLITGGLQIGRTALVAYQQALQIVGNNIANAGNPNYTRVTPGLSPRAPGAVVGLQVGSGVQVSSVRRHVLESLEARLRASTADREAATSTSTALDRVDAVFDAIGDAGLGTAIDNFFRAFKDLQSRPEDTAARTLVVTRAQTLTQTFRDVRLDLIDLREDLNTDIVSMTRRADAISSQIAELNTGIIAAEGTASGQAASLRDQRDGLLRELSTLVQVTTREQDNGAVNVYIGSEPLVQFGYSRGLHAAVEPAGGGLTNATVRFSDNNGIAIIRGGAMAGSLVARDQHIGGQLDRINTLAAAFIQEVNKQHASGQGLSGYRSLTGGNAVRDPNAALNSLSAGLALTPRSGTFVIGVRDSAGVVTRHQLTVDLDGLGGNDTTLAGLVAQINAQTGGQVTATALPDGRMSLSAGPGVSFVFEDDRSHVLAALGVNSFFSGRDATDIDVNDLVVRSPALIAAATNGQAGDGSNAGLLGGLGSAGVAGLDGASLVDYYQGGVTQAAVSANQARSELSATQTIFDALQAQRESISGVNLDEEAINLVAYQRSFEGAARYLSVINSSLQTLLSLVG